MFVYQLICQLEERDYGDVQLYLNCRRLKRWLSCPEFALVIPFSTKFQVHMNRGYVLNRLLFPSGGVLPREHAASLQQYVAR